jgi:hypothetical protein
MLVGAEGSGWREKAVYERRLAVIDVRDDGDIANVFHIIWLIEPWGQRRGANRLMGDGPQGALPSRIEPRSVAANHKRSSEG